MGTPLRHAATSFISATRRVRAAMPMVAALLMAMPLRAQDNTTDGYVWPEEPAVREQLDHWKDLKFGVLIHWGLYSIPGIVESWNLCNEDWIVRPEGSTYEGYKQWYWGLSQEFAPAAFAPSQWASVFADAGMKYMIFTTKHHDGFCLFDSAYTDFSVAHSGSTVVNEGTVGSSSNCGTAGTSDTSSTAISGDGAAATQPWRDAARYVFEDFRGRGFMIGAYFSKPDWHHPGFWNPYYATPNRRINYKKEMHPDWWESYVSYTQNQLREITGGRYGRIDILWLDGGWITGDEVGLNQLLPEMRRFSPGMLCVDRTIEGPNENYQTPEQAIPPQQLDHPWESCITLTDDWGWTPNARYKSARRIIGTLAEIVAKGGSLALGVGPTADGVINPEAVEVLHEIGAWMRRCGSAIYDTRTTPLYNDGLLWFTASKDGRTLYAIYALPDGADLPSELSWSGNLPAGRVTLLNTGARLRPRISGNRVILSLPRNLLTEPLALRFEIR